MSLSISSSLDHHLRTVLGDAGWRLDDAVREAHGRDDSQRFSLPDAVALPESVEQVAEIVRVCRAHRVPIVARGAGTGTAAAAVPFAGGVVMSFARMNRILRLSPEDRVAVVEPGVINASLQQAAAAYGLFWAPDPSSFERCTVGGNLATNAGGPRAVKYGATRDNVLGITAVTGAGDVIRCGGPWTKNATGFDLSHLLVGSEGTLGLIVEATLRLLPLPPMLATLRALYQDTNSAAAAVSRLMGQAQIPTMLEFMDAQSLQLLRRNGAELPEAGALLMIEADGDEETLPLALAALGQAAEGEGLISLDVAMDGLARDRLWSARRALSPALRTLAPGKINEDVVVPVSRIPDLVKAVEHLSKASELPIVTFGHAGNGNLHVNIMYHPEDADQTQCARNVLPKLFETVLQLGGTLSGEHGIGVAKRDFMRQAIDAPTLSAMRAIKAALDPDGILNPGKVLP